MRNKAALVAAVLVLSLAAGYGVSKATGYWKTKGSKNPIKIQKGEFAGENDPGDIRGSYSFDDIDAAFGVPPQMMAAAFGLKGDNPGALQAKSLETTWGELEGGVEIGTDAVRLFTALWTGIPYDMEETTVLPEAAVEILETYNKIDAQKAVQLRISAVKLPNAAAGEELTDVTEDHEVPDRMVRGLTTFGDLQDWGVTEEMWLEEFGKPMGSKADDMKDWADETEIPMSEIKSAVQEMVDSGA